MWSLNCSPNACRSWKSTEPPSTTLTLAYRTDASARNLVWKMRLTDRQPSFSRGDGPELRDVCCGHPEIRLNRDGVSIVHAFEIQNWICFFPHRNTQRASCVGDRIREGETRALRIESCMNVNNKPITADAGACLSRLQPETSSFWF